MLAGGDKVRSVTWRKGVIAPDDVLRLRGAAVNALERGGFSDIDLQCTIVKHAPEGMLLSVGGQSCDLVQSLQWRGFPFNRYESLNTPLSLTNSPVIRRDRAAEALFAMLSELRHPILLRCQSLDGGLIDTLENANHRFQVVDAWERASLKTSGTFDAWLAGNFDHKRRKELKRLRNRLAEQGNLVFQRLESPDNPNAFINDFLRLEHEGWKGARGTSIMQHRGMEAALREGLAQLAASGKLRFWRMSLDGIAIASMFAAVDGPQVTLGKMAYDEKFAKYSPGQLIVLEATKDFFDDPTITIADGNAIPNHPMIDRLWRDRAAFGDILLAPDTMSASNFRLACLKEQIRRKLRNAVKFAYYKMKRELPS